MESYVTQELRELILNHFPADASKVGIFGHSMGGHGALVLALRYPKLYQSVSAFAPIAAPSQCPWGQKAFSHYLGEDTATWRAYDASALVEDGKRVPPILIDQGLSDQFLVNQLNPDVFEAACQQHNQPLTLRRHQGYDHGYYFISTFMADHFAHHVRCLVG
jgi:S-formylglutathione hydrolase